MSKGNGISFADLKAARGGLVQVVTPGATAQSNVNDSVGELAHMWSTRLEYAKALIAAGAPDSEVLNRAEALTVQDHRSRVRMMLQVFALNPDATVPNGLKYAAEVLGLETKAKQAG